MCCCLLWCIKFIVNCNWKFCVMFAVVVYSFYMHTYYIDIHSFMWALCTMHIQYLHSIYIVPMVCIYSRILVHFSYIKRFGWQKKENVSMYKQSIKKFCDLLKYFKLYNLRLKYYTHIHKYDWIFHCYPNINELHNMYLSF